MVIVNIPVILTGVKCSYHPSFYILHGNNKNCIEHNLLLVINLIVGDSLYRNNKMKFSTPDQDNGLLGFYNCAISWRGGWWFEKCSWANPNGPLADREQIGGARFVMWYHWKTWESLKTMQLMIRPRV